MDTLLNNQVKSLFDVTADDSSVKTDVIIKNDAQVLERIRSYQPGNDIQFSLKIEAYVLQLAYAYNKILSLSNSRTKILAHQVESTHIVVSSLNQRFILADEVGLGKTIEAGLIIKEFIYRYNYRRILVACPASLLVQWQLEMEEKFGETFEIIDRKILDRQRKKNALANPWDSFGKVICSLDFIKNRTFSEELKNTKWDAVIFDEAHRLRRDDSTSTMTYNVAEIMSERSKSLLLLTATPFRGKLEELYYLVRLVDKNLFGPFQTFYNSYCTQGADLSHLKEKLSTVLLRRTKKVIGGFTERHARTIRFELFPEERELYDATTIYVIEEFNRALQTENRAVGFVMTVFQKLLDSSSFALYSALKNRKHHLETLLSRAKEDSVIEEKADEILRDFDPDYEENYDEDEICDEIIKKTIAELEEEIRVLTGLVNLASGITRNKKAEKLRNMMLMLRKNGHKKFLIFTQFRTTQDYLAGILKGFSVEVFNGSMSKDQKEIAIEKFKNETEVLICTEAGGEGRNMQFCNILFNYDLPWSPLKIEQRIGRLHRFGQKYDVYIYNFSTKDTVAERILDVLTRKLNLFEESIGTPDVMLGQIEDEVNLSSLFMKMTAGKIRKKDVDSEIEHSVNLARKSFEKLSELTVSKRMDFNYDEYYRITQKERKYSNRQLENFITRFNSILPKDGKILKKIKDNHYELLLEGYEGRTGTFDSETALMNSKFEFLAFGHEIVDKVIEGCRTRLECSDCGIKIIDHDEPVCGMIFNYVVSFRSVEETKEFFPVFIPSQRNQNDFKSESIEDDILHQTAVQEIAEEHAASANAMFVNAESYFRLSKIRLMKKIREKTSDIEDNLNLSIDPEIEKIEYSFEKQLEELNEKLDRQEFEMHNQGKDMKSVITRTKNQIIKAEKEKQHLLAKYKRYQGVDYSIELVSAGAVISR
ncbi:MAG: DEAD/DEAH box helicase family protein [Spirochaetes bacterium]|nr:DEAD/DEAH box helicase family protein [Spirochaetota bacterium]